MSNRAVIKANFRDDLRRVTFGSEEEITFDSLVAALQSRFGLDFPIRLTYTDQDGDDVELRSTDDLKATWWVAHCQGSSALRLQIHRSDELFGDDSTWAMAHSGSRPVFTRSVSPSMGSTSPDIIRSTSPACAVSAYTVEHTVIPPGPNMPLSTSCLPREEATFATEAPGASEYVIVAEAVAVQSLPMLNDANDVCSDVVEHRKVEAAAAAGDLPCAQVEQSALFSDPPMSTAQGIGRLVAHKEASAITGLDLTDSVKAPRPSRADDSQCNGVIYVQQEEIDHVSNYLSAAAKHATTPATYETPLSASEIAGPAHIITPELRSTSSQTIGSSYYALPESFLLDDFGDTNVNVEAMNDKVSGRDASSNNLGREATWVEHVVNEGQYYRIILQTRVGHEWSQLPPITDITEGIVASLRRAGIYTEAQLSRIGQRLAIVIAGVLPAVVTSATAPQPECTSDEDAAEADAVTHAPVEVIDEQECCVREANVKSGYDSDATSTDTELGSTMPRGPLTARFPTNMHGSTLLAGGCDSDSDGSALTASGQSTPKLSKFPPDPPAAGVVVCNAVKLQDPEQRERAGVPLSVPDWELNRWASNLQELADMGLIDIELNVLLLRMYDGQVQRVVEHLFST